MTLAEVIVRCHGNEEPEVASVFIPAKPSLCVFFCSPFFYLEPKADETRSAVMLL